MSEKPSNRELGFYVALSQVGFEMVAPMGGGIALDWYFGWKPWGLVIGFIFGFVGGFIHLLALLKQHDDDVKKRRPPGDSR